MKPLATVLMASLGATKCATVTTVAVTLLAREMCPTSLHSALKKSMVTVLMCDKFPSFFVLVFSVDDLLCFGNKCDIIE